MAQLATEPLVQVNHYQAYRPKPFTREEREKTTILYGGLTWKHERLMQGALENLKYNAAPLPNITRDDLDAGKELIDVGACCPTIFTTGSLVNFLKKESAAHGKQEVAKKYVFLTAGACGPCRFGQYHESYAMALDGLGLRDLRVFLMAQDELNQDAANGGGLDINLPFSLGLIWSILCGDLVTDLEYMTRPYEVNPGQTDQVLKESIEYLYEVFRNRPNRGEKYRAIAWQLLSSYFTRALREVRKIPSVSKPSIVSRSWPETVTASVRHALIGMPSMRTVQAPHTPMPQPSFVPVSAKSSRSTSMRRRLG